MNMKKIIALVMIMVVAMGMFTAASADVDLTPVKNMTLEQVHTSVIKTDTEASGEYTKLDKEYFDQLMETINLDIGNNENILLCINIMTVDDVYTVVWYPAQETGYLYGSVMDATNLAWHGAVSATYGVYCELPTYYVCYAQYFDEPLTGSDEDIQDYITSMLAYGTILAMFQEA